MSSQQSKYQIYLDERKNILADKNKELTERQQDYDYSYSMLQQIQGLHRQRHELLAYLEDLAIEEFENLDKFKLANQQTLWFQKVRSFPEFTKLDITPQERLLKKYRLMEGNINRKNQELNTELLYVEEKISTYCSLEEYELWLLEQEEKIQELQNEIQEIEFDIEGLEATYQALLNQQAMETQLQQNMDYLIAYWYEDSTEWINTFLRTEEGPHKNVPFCQDSIDQLALYLDQNLVYDRKFTYVEDEQQAIKRKEIYTELHASFSKELIIAFAQTLHLQLFPDDFFEGETGGFGLVMSSDGTLTYTGNSPQQVANDILCSVDAEGTPQMCLDALERKDTNCRFYYSFRPRQEGDVSTIKQLCNMRRFHKEFWRFNNFFEFNIHATLQVYPKKVTDKEQKEAYHKYKKYMKDTGSYLQV